jgi:hypothetical protein
MIHEISRPKTASIDPESKLNVDVSIPPDSCTLEKLPVQLAKRKKRNR